MIYVSYRVVTVLDVLLHGTGMHIKPLVCTHAHMPTSYTYTGFDGSHYPSSREPGKIAKVFLHCVDAGNSKCICSLGKST